MSNENKKNEMDRRNFLLKSIQSVGTGILMASPLEMFLTNVLMGVFGRANALAAGDESGYLDKKLVNLTLTNGPSRWFWDLPLRPNGNDAFSYNTTNDPITSMLITKLNAGSGGGGYTGEYASVKIGEYYLPHLWSGLMATPNGGTAPMSNLAQNMLMMRGLDWKVDSHELDRYLQMVPTGNSSLLGLVADKATTVLPSIGVGFSATNSNFFHSGKGITSRAMDGNDPFTSVFSPFTNSAGLRSTNAIAGAAIDRALDIMKAKSGSKSSYLPNTYQDRANAKKMMLLQFSGLSASFLTLKTKYENLISRSFGDVSLRLAGLDNVAVGGAQSNQYRMLFSNRNSFYTGADIRTLTTINSTIANLAASMAVSEFMLTGGGISPQSFTSSINIMVGDSVNNVAVDSAFSAASGALGSQNFSNITYDFNSDAHETGSYIQMILFSRYYRAISSCLYELVNQLKAVTAGSGTLFDQTAISITSEFNRSARNNAGGADHGWNGSCYSIISGMVTQPTVAGDIKVNSTTAGGSWGIASPMTEFSGQNGLIGNVASTLATMLEFKTPTPNNPSYVSKNSLGKVQMAVAKPKNVA